MTKRTVMISIRTLRNAVAESLFEQDEIQEEDLIKNLMPQCEEEPSEMLMEGRLVTSPSRVELIYEEGELTGMEGSVTSIGFDRGAPYLISMMRTGLVSTAMVFEKGKRHLCLYNTPFSEFEICVHALQVENRLLQEGYLYIDYLIEVHGAQAERCKMTIRVQSNQEADRFEKF